MSAPRLAFVGLGIDRLPFERFVAFKAGFAVANGILVTPLVALVALREIPLRSPRPEP